MALSHHCFSCFLARNRKSAGVVFYAKVLILLHGDPDYRFIIVEDFGYVVSYNPRTFQGDVQTMLSVFSISDL